MGLLLLDLGHCNLLHAGRRREHARQKCRRPQRALQHSARGLTFASITWFINGICTATPTIKQLFAIAENSGYWIVFGALKNNPFGEFFGSKPAWLPFSADAECNACRALMALEILAAEGGLAAGDRATKPFFGPALGQEWCPSLLDNVFVMLLRCGAGLSEQKCRAHSVHSFRILFACALYATKCPNERILAILRWSSVDALLIYARMNNPEHADWVLKSMSQNVDSTVAAHLPHLDADSWVAALQ